MTLQSFKHNNQKVGQAEICEWYNNKAGAVSISFDDAGYSQFEYAYPIMQKYGIKGTFSLVGEWTNDVPSYSSETDMFQIKKMCWDNIVELHKNGHEIAAHGYRHIKYGREDHKDSLILQMLQIKNLIESKTNAEVYTMHYPYSYTSTKIINATKEAGYLFGRTAGDSNNLSTPSNFFLLASVPILNSTQPSMKDIDTYVENAKGRWLILMYHHFFTDQSKEMTIMRHHKVTNTYSVLPELFDQQMEILHKSDCWIAPIAHVGKYTHERNNTGISTKYCGKSITVSTQTSLNTKVYDHALSIKIEIPWSKVKIEGSSSDGTYVVQNNTLIFNTMPGSTVKIRKVK
ncbi:MAG: polysaccharide deacetylase family protein [Bacteroidetes bacterium]|nr:polysaccharide deacetylase family protein [Bacteroidota bacterium]